MSLTRKEKLTVGRVNDAKPHKSERYFIRDVTFGGFALLVHPTGRKVYTYQYDLPNGRSRRVTLGDANLITLDEAREMARKTGRVQAGTGAALWTVREAFERYIEKPNSERHKSDLRRYLDTYMVEFELDDVRLCDLTRAQVAQAFEALQKRAPAQALKAFNALSKAYKIALALTEEGQLPGNPVPPVLSEFAIEPEYSDDDDDDDGAETALAPDDLPAWFTALGSIDNPSYRLLFELGLFSGLRAERIASLRLEWVKEDRISIPRGEMKHRKKRTGRGKTFDCPLSGHMREVVAQAVANARLHKSEWLFPGNSKAGHIASWQKYASKLATGKKLRQAHRTFAFPAGVDSWLAEMLQDRNVPSHVANRYIKRGDLFDTLMEAQERISHFILKNGGGFAEVEKVD